MNIDSFETLIKLIIKHNEVILLCDILALALFGDFKLYREEDEEEYKSEVFLTS
jgi:hypothetical protein